MDHNTVLPSCFSAVIKFKTVEWENRSNVSENFNIMHSILHINATYNSLIFSLLDKKEGYLMPATWKDVGMTNTKNKKKVYQV